MCGRYYVDDETAREIEKRRESDESEFFFWNVLSYYTNLHEDIICQVLIYLLRRYCLTVAQIS